MDHTLCSLEITKVVELFGKYNSSRVYDRKHQKLLLRWEKDHVSSLSLFAWLWLRCFWRHKHNISDSTSRMATDTVSTDKVMVGFVGAGKMAQAICRGLLSSGNYDLSDCSMLFAVIWTITTLQTILVHYYCMWSPIYFRATPGQPNHIEWSTPEPDTLIKGQ